MANDDLYKREEDRKWRERVDERLAALTSGETVQDDRLDAMEEALRETDKTIRGDPGGGIIEEIHEISGQLRRVNAILWPDAVGNGGLVSTVSKLMKKEERAEKQMDNRWKFATAVLVVAISSGLVGRYLEKIETFFRGITGQESTTPAKTKASKRSGSKRHRAPVQEDEQESNGGE